MTHEISIQLASKNTNIPEESFLEECVKRAILGDADDVEICIRIIDEQEMQELNHHFRGKDKPTNVLSFPYHDEFDNENTIHGDIIICAPIVELETKEQNKSIKAHWAHLTVHGALHIQGYDHENEQDAKVMENHEVNILNQLGFDNPYLIKTPEQ